jgi:hypothetical protein
MLDTGRAKDHARLVQFFEFDAVRRDALEQVVKRHRLESKWVSFRERFLNEGS